MESGLISIAFVLNFLCMYSMKLAMFVNMTIKRKKKPTNIIKVIRMSAYFPVASRLLTKDQMGRRYIQQKLLDGSSPNLHLISTLI